VHRAAVRVVWSRVGIAEGIHHVAVGVELNNHGRLMPGVEVVVRQIAPVQDEYVIARIYAQATDSTGHPEIRQRLGPAGIDFELGSLALRVHWSEIQER